MNNLLCNESTDDNLYYMYMYMYIIFFLIKKSTYNQKKYLHKINIC